MNVFLNLFNLRATEVGKFAHVSLLNFLVMFGIYLARAGRDVLFYLEIGPQYLPWMFVATAFFSIFANEIFARATGKFSQQSIFKTLLIISCIVMLNNIHSLNAILNCASR